MRIVLAHLLATPLDDFQRIVVDAASVSVIVIDGSQRRVVLANDTGGLERFGEPALAPWEAAADGGRRRRRKLRG